HQLACRAVFISNRSLASHAATASSMFFLNLRRWLIADDRADSLEQALIRDTSRAGSFIAGRSCLTRVVTMDRIAVSGKTLSLFLPYSAARISRSNDEIETPWTYFHALSERAVSRTSPPCLRSRSPTILFCACGAASRQSPPGSGMRRIRFSSLVPLFRYAGVISYWETSPGNLSVTVGRLTVTEASHS